MTFLRRFRDPTPPPKSASASEVDSIVHNLTQILRSQRAFASFLPDFGLDDPGRHPITPKSLDLLRQQILEQVERYEPRIEEPRLAMMPQTEAEAEAKGKHGSFRFKLTGQLQSGTLVCLIIQLSRFRNRQPRLEVRTLD